MESRTNEGNKDAEKPYRPAVRYTYIGMGIWVKDHAFKTKTFEAMA